ncbi:siderophore-interacting protein [Solirubrobacter phytolaccae]|uniref:Siderophore-interacting protein n=1 Tax=Solirubrobacter phytolaccae TaxID=1404360 RepID=A0A9X3N483_9ACTN|nr:siderophore-interacting protein [Solirubrobacter phytolaccae]MDA0179575.1 siderophore-interacting protein [Solirubrobacter phytolaccae]
MLTATLKDTLEVTPRMLRLTFEVPGAAQDGRPDDWLQIFFGEPGDHENRRNYTVRALRPGEVVVDFALHAGGLAATWAREARPGAELVWIETEGGYDPPPDAQWQLLVGDLTALPAIGRIVEGLPAGTRAKVVAEVFDEADRQEWQTEADLDVRWLHGSGDGAAGSRLDDVVRSCPDPFEDGYVWMAGETRTVRSARRYLRHELGVDRTRYSLTGYWLARSEEWLERYAPIADDMAELWESGVASGRDPEELQDDYDNALERAGL